MLDSGIRGRQHHETPFHVGFPLESGRFVHVLDEMTVNLLLDELDTVPDLVSYLACKEAFISTPGVLVSIPGEEEILAAYMLTLRDGQHSLLATASSKPPSSADSTPASRIDQRPRFAWSSNASVPDSAEAVSH